MHSFVPKKEYQKLMNNHNNSSKNGSQLGVFLLWRIIQTLCSLKYFVLGQRNTLTKIVIFSTAETSLVMALTRNL